METKASHRSLTLSRHLSSRGPIPGTPQWRLRTSSGSWDLGFRSQYSEPQSCRRVFVLRRESWQSLAPRIVEEDSVHH